MGVSGWPGVRRAGRPRLSPGAGAGPGAACGAALIEAAKVPPLTGEDLWPKLNGAA